MRERVGGSESYKYVMVETIDILIIVWIVLMKAVKFGGYRQPLLL